MFGWPGRGFRREDAKSGDSPFCARRLASRGTVSVLRSAVGLKLGWALCCLYAVWGVSGTAFGQAGELAPIKIELPKPYFGGTPLDYFGPNLEKPNYKRRPPFPAPQGTANVAPGKTVTSSVSDLEFGSLDFLNDGDKNYKKQSLLGLGPGLQWIQIDLGAPHALYAVLFWHFHEGERVYFDISVRVADDAEFTKNVQVVFNNDHDNSAGLGIGKDKEYIESYTGKLVDAKGITGRYVRFSSKGNTTNDMNHYVEAEVFGKLVANP